MLSVSVSASAGCLSALANSASLLIGQRAFQQRIGGMHVQMHEAGIGRSREPQRFDVRRWCGTRARRCPSAIGTPRRQPCRLSPAHRAADAAVIRAASAGGGPPSWHGSRASPGSDAIHVRSGMGVGRGYPRQTGMTSGGTAKTSTQTRKRYQTHTKHAEMTLHVAEPSTACRDDLRPDGDHAEKQGDRGQVRRLPPRRRET